MPSLIDRPFKLLPRHFHGGVTSKDLSDYLGRPVPVFSMQDFPYWNKMRNGLAVSEQEYKQRATAIYGAGERAFREEGKRFTIPFSRCEELAKWRGSVVSYCTFPLDRPWEPSSAHFRELQINGLHQVQQMDVCYYSNRPTFCVYPEPIEHEGHRRNNSGTWYYRADSIVLLEPPEDDDRTYWTSKVFFPPGNIVRYPKGQWGHIANALHELRHVVQISVRNSGEDPLEEYYEELDADLFYRDAIRATGLGDEFLAASLKARYLGIVYDSTVRYWFAPTMDALENRLPVPSYSQVIKSAEILRGAMSWGFKTREAFHHACAAAPAGCYNLLLEAQDKPEVRRDPLAMDMAEKIKAAIFYFCPQATRPALNTQRTIDFRHD